MIRTVAISVDITPERPTTLGCAPDLHTPHTSVRERLEAGLIAIYPSDPLGAPILLVGVDLLYPGPELRPRLEEALLGVLPRERLWLSATHTHRAPLTDRHKPGLGEASDDYIQFLSDRLVRAARLVLETPATWAQMEVHSGSMRQGINRRRTSRWLDRELTSRIRTRLAPNPKGPTDDTVVLAVLKDSQGRPSAIIWNYACHPVGDPEQLAVAGHFPAVVREGLRTHYRLPHLPVVFLQGFSGDIRPVTTTRPHTVRQRANRLLFGPQFFDMTMKSYRSWTHSLTQNIIQLTQTEPARSDAIDIVAARSTVPTSEFVDGSRPSADTTFHALRLGDLLTIAGVSAEVVCEYAEWTRSLARTRNVMCVGCMDDTFGYVPTEAMLLEGGYEAGGYCTAFGLESVRPGIEALTRRNLAWVVNSVSGPS